MDASSALDPAPPEERWVMLQDYCLLSCSFSLVTLNSL